MEEQYSMNEIYVKDVFSQPMQPNEGVSVMDVVLDDRSPVKEIVDSFEYDRSSSQIHEDEGQYARESADGKKYWKPEVPIECIPKVGDLFNDIQYAEDFYRNYGRLSGFDIRLANRKTNKGGTITNRYFYCSKEGKPEPKSFDSLNVSTGVRKRRNTNTKRCGYKACFKVRYVKEKGIYEVYKFIEWHNHVLFDQDEMIFLRSSRQLSYAEQKNVYESCSQKIGVVKGQRIRKSMVGALSKSGGTKRDYHNYRRDMSTFVGNKDAQMLINTMASRQGICPEYFYEFTCKDNELQAIFWADETARLNYKEFGDVISFDATFRTNKHAMSFVPFVAIDNHQKSVVVGAALIAGETAENYKWILSAFLKAHGRQPLFVITDQCLAMKQAIPAILPESKHRLCMWHITKKVEAKISVHLKNETSFVTDFNNIVWDVNLEPSVFELKWGEMMEKYDLADDDWFQDMFDIRDSWIPAYFKDAPMSGLMKTTSRSESINVFFNVFHALFHDLVLFLRSFDHAIETQRAENAAEQVKTKSTLPRMLTPSGLEEHASILYTRTIFFEFQKELCEGMYECLWDGSSEVGGNKVVSITEENDGGQVISRHTVVRDKESDTLDCSCNFFVRNGILCRHSLKVLVNEKAKFIPERYIMRRWRRELVPVDWLPAKVRYGEVDAESEKMIGNVQLSVEWILEHVRSDKESLSSFAEYIQKYKDDVVADAPRRSNRERKNANFQEFMGVSDVDNLQVLPPTGVRNKGCGTGKRLIGCREKAITKAKKKMRVCRKCGQLARHDSRNCTES